jgi:cytochrome c6
MTRLAPLLFLLLLGPAAHAADAMKGGRIYRTHCASCHGATGIATLPNAPSFARGERIMQPDPVLLATIRTGRGAMPGFFGILSDRDTLDVIAYLRTMR